MAICFWPAIQQVTAGVSSSPTAITRDSQWTIIAVETNGPFTCFVELPAGADVGDLVEVHNNPVLSNQTPTVSAPSGETLEGQTSTGFFRKISSVLWSGI